MVQSRETRGAKRGAGKPSESPETKQEGERPSSQLKAGGDTTPMTTHDIVYWSPCSGVPRRSEEGKGGSRQVREAAGLRDGREVWRALRNLKAGSNAEPIMGLSIVLRSKSAVSQGQQISSEAAEQGGTRWEEGCEARCTTAPNKMAPSPYTGSVSSCLSTAGSLGRREAEDEVAGA